MGNSKDRREDFAKARILAMHRAGHKPADIALAIPCTRKQVTIVLARYVDWTPEVRPSIVWVRS